MKRAPQIAIPPCAPAVPACRPEAFSARAGPLCLPHPDLSVPPPGRNRFSVRERETTVTELMAIASPAHSGFMVMWKSG